MEKKSLDVHALRLLNDQNKVCAELTTSENRPEFILLDDKQTERCRVGVGKNGVSLQLNDQSGVPRVEVVCSNDGNSHVNLSSDISEKPGHFMPVVRIECLDQNHRIVVCSSDGKTLFSTNKEDEIGDYPGYEKPYC